MKKILYTMMGVGTVSYTHLTAEPGVDKVYLGRPWRPYAYT